MSYYHRLMPSSSTPLYTIRDEKHTIIYETHITPLIFWLSHTFKEYHPLLYTFRYWGRNITDKCHFVLVILSEMNRLGFDVFACILIDCKTVTIDLIDIITCINVSWFWAYSFMQFIIENLKHYLRGQNLNFKITYRVFLKGCKFDGPEVKLVLDMSSGLCRKHFSN